MSKRGRTFKRVGALNPGRSVFDLSHELKFTCDFGQLIPCCFLEANPGDTFKIHNELVLRFQPLVKPIMHEIYVTTHYFFVPTRLIWKEWEQFITKGEDGQDNTPLPLWAQNESVKYTLWDYFGLPIGFTTQSDYAPIDFPKRVYNFVYNEYYRDENLIPDEVDPLSNVIQNRAYLKDYFTASLPFQQRGTSPSFPVAGNASIDWNNIIIPEQWIKLKAAPDSAYPNIPLSNDTVRAWATNNNASPQTIQLDWRNSAMNMGPGTNATYQAYNPAQDITPILKVGSDVNLSGLHLNADINDIRQGVQIQRWLERNARAGVRYTEFLTAHHGVAPEDSRLQRPEYIGGSKSPIIVSEVLQTSASNTQPTPQANLAGHGITADRTKIGSYHVKEYGYIIGIMSVMPKPAYFQGIPRILLRRTPFDFYFREFANLSERTILNCEIYAKNGDDTYNGGNFGFIPQYDELRVEQDKVMADMRDDFNKWHLARIFSNASPPMLNKSFIECNSQSGGPTNPLKRVFAVPSERGLVVNYANRITAIRPMPANPEPGYMDHF